MHTPCRLSEITLNRTQSDEVECLKMGCIRNLYRISARDVQERLDLLLVEELAGDGPVVLHKCAAIYRYSQLVYDLLYASAP